MTDVFISYSRKDKEFVQVLHKALASSQYDAWVDWEDIPLTADWWAEIQTGIEAANTFVFVISPDSVDSKVCTQEVDYAVRHNKRLVPIVRREGFSNKRIHPALSRHNWLFFRSDDEFSGAFDALVQALDTDLERVRLHTRLLVRAREWSDKDGDADFLLRGHDLETSETWLATAADKPPQPTALQRKYILHSRQAETARQRQERRRLQVFGGVVAVLALLATGLAIRSWQQRQIAVAQREEAYRQSKIAFAHQLAVEVKQAAAAQILSLKDTSLEVAETTLAFGLATLPRDLATVLRQEAPRLIVFSPSKNFVAIINQDYGLRVWQVEPRQQVLAWEAAANVVDVGFSPDETLLTVATQDGALNLWQVTPGRYQSLGTLQGHRAPLNDSSFNQTGQYLATASQDGTAKIWQLSGNEVATLAHGSPVTSIAFDPENHYVVTGSADAQLRVWSLARELQFCIGHQQSVNLVRFDANGLNLGSVSDETLVRIWPWQELLEQPQRFQDLQRQC